MAAKGKGKMRSKKTEQPSGGAKRPAGARKPAAPAPDAAPSAPNRPPRPTQEPPKNIVALFLRAAGAPFWIASIMPVLIGSALPLWLRPDGFVFSWARAIEALVAMVLLHAGADLANEYYDYLSAADSGNPLRGGLSGGSGILPDGKASPRFLFGSFVACFAVGIALGLHLNAVSEGNVILWTGLAGVLGGFFYSAAPLRFSYRGLGEIVLGLCFGVLPVMGAYYVQTGTLSGHVVLASLPITFAIVLVLWVNQIPDVRADADAGKRTMVVRIGARNAARVGVPVLAALVYATLFASVFTGSIVPLVLVAVLAFGFARTVVVDCWQFYDEPAELRQAQVMALKFHLSIGLTIAIALALIAVIK